MNGDILITCYSQFEAITGWIVPHDVYCDLRGQDDDFHSYI